VVAPLHIFGNCGATVRSDEPDVEGICLPRLEYQ
jgi:hypothetical protein